jgi:hypothetical protein
VRTIFIAVITLASAASLLAQGHVVFTGSIHPRHFDELSSLTNYFSSEHLTPHQIQVILMEQNRNGSGNNSGSPIPPGPPINSGGLIIVPVGSTVEFPTDGGFMGFYSAPPSGAELMEASRQNTLIDQPVMPLLPPTPVTVDFQPQLVSLAIQTVPEPSTFTLGGLALGLMVIMGMRNKVKMANKMANKPSENRAFK